MSEVAARSLTARGARLRVVNRNPERAAALAEACSGEARPLEDLATELSEADVVISSTSKSGFMITHELMQGVCKMRRYRPLFIIDIAVPRDVDPRVDSLRNIFLYDLDDLEKVSQENLATRQLAATEAEQIIASEVTHYNSWLRSLALTPTIVALRARVREVVLRERDKAMPKLSSMSAKDSAAIDAMCNAIVNQLLHGPLTELKNSADGPDATRMVDTVQRLFALEVDDPEHTATDEDETGLTPAHERGGRGG